ncbi:MAG TPA: YncE family protein [Xanthobacteraceae bacterium]|nr:YncE family protein [Xanthobacteraceae bacterium]
MRAFTTVLFTLLGVWSMPSGIAVILASLTDAARAQVPPAEPLRLETQIQLGEVRGRIDHMAIDRGRNRLIVAELENDSVAIVDVNDRKVIHVITGLKEPQGVAYVPSADMLYVANAGDGSVRLFGGGDYAPAGAIALGSDADNIRIAPSSKTVFVGYGSGALAVIDAASQRKIADMPLGAHPESFQLTPDGGRVYVNLPTARAIAVLDAATRKRVATWPATVGTGNFAMALDDATQRVIVVFRTPARLAAFSMVDSGLIEMVETCGDADDVFVDAKRQRIYVSCGDGYLDVFDKQNHPYRRVAHIRTAAGARTSLFVPEFDRLFVAARASAGEPASIRVFQPAP